MAEEEKIMVRGFLQLCCINKYQARHVHHKYGKTKPYPFLPKKKEKKERN